MTEHEPLLRRAYALFNARDMEGALALMHPYVDWPNAMEGGRVRGRSEVRDYWTRQFTVIDPRVDPEHFVEDEQGRIVVDVRQVIHDPAGRLLSDRRVRHVYAIRNGLIERMDVKGSIPAS